MRINYSLIEKEMARNGMTMVELLNTTKLSPDTLARIKKGHDVRPTTVNRIMKALNCTVEELINCSNQLF